MNDQQVAEIAEFMARTWPKNDMDDSEVQSWRRILLGINVPDAARQALIRLKDSTSFNNPNRKEFLDIIRRQTGGAVHSQEPMPEAWPGYVQSMDTGYFVPLCYAGDRPDDHQINQHLQFLRDGHQRVYGGEWQIVREPGRDVTVREMIDRRQQVRGTVPLDAQRAARMAGLQPQEEYRGVPTRTEPAKPDKLDPEPGQPIRQAVAAFMAGKPVRHEAPPPYLKRQQQAPQPAPAYDAEDFGPAPSEDEAGQYQQQDEPFD